MSGRKRVRWGWIGALGAVGIVLATAVAVVGDGPRSLWHRLTGRSGGEPGPRPDTSGFYRAIDPGHGRRGEVLRTEDLAATADVPPGTRLFRIVYRTLSAQGAPTAASAAIAIPPDPKNAPIAVWGHGAVGTAPGCGPSRSGFAAPYAADLLNAGFIVVAPDYTGLGMEGVPYPYLHGISAGRSVLDAARAAIALDPRAGTRVALYGTSAGGHAVLWANQLASGADGEGLDISAVVALAPVGNLRVTMDYYAATAGLVPYSIQVAGSWPAVAPELEPGAVLTTAALERRDRLGEQCIGQLLATFSGTPSRWVIPTGFADAAWSHQLAEQSPGAEPGAAAVLVLQGGRDGAVLPAWTGQLVGDLRSGGTKVELVVDDDADHGSILDAGRQRAVRFLVGGPAETS